MSTTPTSSDAGSGPGADTTPAVLVVADPGREKELADAFVEPLPYGKVDVLVSSGGDDTIDLFESRSPRVVILTASLEEGDAKSLIEALRDMVPREHVVIVLVGDDETGIVRTALDAIDMKPDRFVSRPLSAKALRFAVQSGLENVARALGEPVRSEDSGSGRTTTLPPDKTLRPPNDARAKSTTGRTTTLPPDKTLRPPDRPANKQEDDRPTRPITSRGLVVTDSPHGMIETAAGSSPVILIGPRPTLPGTPGGLIGANEIIGDEELEDSGSIAISTDDIDDHEQPQLSRTETPVRGSAPTPRTRTGDISKPPPVTQSETSGTKPSPSVGRAPTDRGLGMQNVSPAATSGTTGPVPTAIGSEPSAPISGPLRARWEALADSIADDDLLDDDDVQIDDGDIESIEDNDGSPPPPVDASLGNSSNEGAPPVDASLGNSSNAGARPVDAGLGNSSNEGAPPVDASLGNSSNAGARPGEVSPLRKSSNEGASPPPVDVNPRRKSSTNPGFIPVPPVAPWRPGTAPGPIARDAADVTGAREGDAAARGAAAGAVGARGRDSSDDIQPPAREPTLIISDPPSPSVPPLVSPPSLPGIAVPPAASASAVSQAAMAVPSMSTASGATIADPHPSLVTPIPSLTPAPPLPPAPDPADRARWSHPVLLSELIDRSRDSSKELLAREDLTRDVDDDVVVGHPRSTPPPHVLRTAQLKALEDMMEPVPPPELGDVSTSAPLPPPTSLGANPPMRPSSPGISRGFSGSGTHPGFSSGSPNEPSPPTERFGAGRDFARQLRAKMSQMAQRLFQSDSPAQPQVNVDVRPRHDHHTEIDLAALGEEPALGGGVTEIESARHRDSIEPRVIATSPGSWDTQVRERGMADAGEILRGSTDCAMILARMFAQSFTGRVSFRRTTVEKIVYFDQGRPVFASSNEPGDRMGELLVREGKITASQYERCQVHVAQSGRRMGEILVDFGYLKRRELLPAVRRHVEDILYSLFGWDDGSYLIVPEPSASAERIRLSRHPASLVLEGIRRKLDRTTLEKLLGPASTIIEVPDRERLGGIINAGDLANEERAALSAFDGHADLAQVARITGIDVADVLPFAWGLCVLGLATARRTEPDVLEESTALVGETDIAIDRERVRARWQLVTEADYFALLGVRRDATAFEIRRAYQAARRDFAADCFPSDLRRELARELEDIASVLDEAFRVLRDDRLRQMYLGNLVE